MGFLLLAGPFSLARSRHALTRSEIIARSNSANTRTFGVNHGDTRTFALSSAWAVLCSG
jgi:hypothetical protein